MICEKCNTKNIKSASFCQNCASPFSEEQKKEAYEKTIYGKIEKLEQLKGYITLEFITGHIIFKIAIIVLIIAAGIFFGRPQGKYMAITEGETYTVSQNEENKDFYLETTLEEIGVGLYLPKEAKTLTLEKEGEEPLEIADGQSLTLKADYENPYTITADYGENTESINVYVFLTEPLEN